MYKLRQRLQVSGIRSRAAVTATLSINCLFPVTDAEYRVWGGNSIFTLLQTQEGNNLKRKECHPLLIAIPDFVKIGQYEGWNFNSGNYLFTTDTK